MDIVLTCARVFFFFFNFTKKKKGEEEEEISKTNQQDEGSLGDANVKHVKKKKNREKRMYVLS